MSFRRSGLLFWLLVLTDLVAVMFNISWLLFIAKPLLMPALAFHLFNSGVEIAGRNQIIAAVFFSWLGDVFLLLEDLNPTFFIAGLVSFLIAHICYIIFFLFVKQRTSSLLKKRPVYILIVAGYGAALVWLLFPHLGALKIPVLIYSTVICSMLLCSIHIYQKVKEPANRFYVTGAALFVLSDSLLAINKFYQPLPLAGVLIMLSYCAAQYFIASGYINAGRKAAF